MQRGLNQFVLLGEWSGVRVYKDATLFLHSVVLIPFLRKLITDKAETPVVEAATACRAVT